MTTHADCREFQYVTRDGGKQIIMSRLTCGCFLCAMCFSYTHPDEAMVDEHGEKWDVCQSCDTLEKQLMIKRASWWSIGAWRFDQQDGENRD